MKFDVATAINQGRRDYQEDAVIADFALGNSFGFAVLADGMGGHAAGDVASKIVVTEVFSELKFQTGDPCRLEQELAPTLTHVVQSANQCIDAHVRNNPLHKGMGATLIAPVIFENRLYWISVGDSPLFLARGKHLEQLNADHSLAPQIDLMFTTGQIDRETALNHPQRNCLTSVLMGSKIAQIDCSTSPLSLQAGDIVIAASDGLQYLDNKQIEAIVAENRMKSSAEIAEVILDALEKLNDPDQDNISLVVIKCDELVH